MTIEVYRDAWGIPHLRASSALELARAQGRNAAADRAWQIEVERHRVQGTTAAFLGADAVAWDRFARQARLADTARRCFAALDADTAAWVAAYTEGVGEGLAEGARNAPEFATTGLEPGRWEPWVPLGIWISTHILFAGFPTKLWREEVARRLGDDLTTLFATDGPGTSGSNGWLVAGTRTGTGAPLIAGDPHRFIEDPGVYQQIHLVCPGIDVVGLAVPGVPGLAHFGHTGSVAWAITNAMADYQDLYRERLRRTADGVEAEGPDGWRPVAHHRETIEVAGGAPVTVDVIETGRGPVIAGDAPAPGAGSAVPGEGSAIPGEGSAIPGEGGTAPGESSAASGEGAAASGGSGTVSEAVSLRYPPRVTAALGFEAIPALLRARTTGDVDRAFDTWVEPVNVVQAADTEGGLLHRVAGRVPVRHEANRLRVVPAWEPEHDWRGWHEAPRAEVGDYAVMANARGIATPLGVEFAPPHRADRIAALLRESGDWTAPGMAAVHTDTWLASAAPLLGLLAALDEGGLTPGASGLRTRLLGWDRRMDADSTGAALFAAVRSAVVRRLAAHPALEPLRGPFGYPEVFLPWLHLPTKIGYALENLLTTDRLPGVDRAELVRDAVNDAAVNDAAVNDAAAAGVTAAGGPEATWGERHRLAPWQALPAPDGEEWPGLPGDHDCVLSTSSVPGVTDLSVRGPAARYVWDLARREDSLWVVPLGARGIPGDTHRRDQLPLWLRGAFVPVVTDFDLLTPEHRTEETHDH
ncbi:penicillin acylase family protein [Streptomyces pacificus]|uniref:Penicillin acylase family protein n=1 Tax=Streptomyces pacificus TaxID=2705029 RepID=A0A6A0AXV0_9ACTN|nr:penicillin acylase family protein [Streptomyces pacificus]GFH37750.1 penicillin acylase family protein [Streptomyces pacificus]